MKGSGRTNMIENGGTSLKGKVIGLPWSAVVRVSSGIMGFLRVTIDHFYSPY